MHANALQINSFASPILIIAPAPVNANPAPLLETSVQMDRLGIQLSVNVYLIRPMDHVHPRMVDALMLKYGEIKPAAVLVLLKISNVFLAISTTKRLVDAKDA